MSSPTGVRVLVHLELEKNTSDGDKFHIFATNIYPYFYDWKQMRSIFDILRKKFQEDQLNSRRFPGFPGVVDTLKLATSPSTEKLYRETCLLEFGHKKRLKG